MVGDFPANGSYFYNWHLGREKGRKGQYLFLAYILTRAALRSLGRRTSVSEARFLGGLSCWDAVSISSVLMATRPLWPCLGKGPLR